MRIYIYLFVINLSIFSFCDIIGQSIWTIKDPNGMDVTIDQDSSFLTIYNGYLLFYTVNSSSGDRNILMSNGDTSFWVLNIDLPVTSDFTPFIFRKNDELIFRIGDVWYSSYGSSETTEVFYDNKDINNEYSFLRIFELYTPSNFHHDLLIEAIEKSTGDTLSLYHNYTDETTTPYAQRLKIIEGDLKGVGPFLGEYFIAAVFDDLEGEWSEVGFYRQNSSGFKLLLPLGLKEHYRINTIYYSGLQWIVDHLDNGEKIVYQYTQSLDSCTDVTMNQFPGYTPLEIINPKWPYWGPQFPNEPQFSFSDIIWRGRNQNGSIRYFLRSNFGQEFEIVDLQNDVDVDFVFSDVFDDSIYYYNPLELDKGLIRANFKNGMSIKESTTSSFDDDFVLQSYNGKMYFGRYNVQSGTIQAISKDFINDNKYEFLESASGERINSPINYSFMSNRIFVHSRTIEGVKLFVFDPDSIVAVKSIDDHYSGIFVTPNPSNGIFHIQLPEIYSYTSDWTYVVFDEKGSLIKNGKINMPEFDVDLTELPMGFYNISILNKKGIVQAVPLILSGK